MCILIKNGNSTRTYRNKNYVSFWYVWNRNKSQQIKNITSNKVSDYGNTKHNNTTTLHHLTSDPTNFKRNG